MKKVLLGLFALALCSSTVLADIADPTLSSCTPCDNFVEGGVIGCPNLPSPIPASIITVTARNSSNNVIPNASVVCQITADQFSCPALVLTATTNGSGVATLTMAWGGCRDGIAGSFIVKVNGGQIRNYSNTKSPDQNGVAIGGGNGQTDAQDLNPFALEFNGIAVVNCGDLDSDGDCDAGDLSIFGPAFNFAQHCP